jgi:2,3-dihydroxybenzoate decarboxylase/5-carboxyvanillate decarboxylase
MAEYFQDNFVVTNSGVEDPLALRYSIDKLGIANVMWAIDYPYQPMKPAVDFIEAFECTERSATPCATAMPSAFSTSLR